MWLARAHQLHVHSHRISAVSCCVPSLSRPDNQVPLPRHPEDKDLEEGQGSSTALGS